MSGKLIRLFLVDGKPEGMKTVEISNMTILGTIFPRTALDMFSKRDAASRSSIIKLRQDLIDAEIMVPNDEGTFIFQKDANFNSPSYAAAAIVGGSANGQIMWKFNGKSLKELEREKNKEEEPIED